MLLRFLCVTGASIFALSTVAKAQDATMKLGVEYHGAIIHDDHGTTKRTGGADPVKTTNITLLNAKLNAEGVATKDVDYRLRFNTLGGLELAYVNLKLTPMVSILMGKYKARQAGFEGRDYGYDTIASSDYFQFLPFGGMYKDMAQVQLAMDFGTIALQLIDDPIGTFNTANKQPAMVLEWLGSFGDWSPLVQVGSYNMNHNMYFAVGVKGGVAGLGLALDYINDSKAAKDAAGKEVKNVYNNINVGVDYKLAGFTPWLKMSMFNVVQAGTDAKENSTASAAAMAAAAAAGTTIPTENWDDNGQLIQVGANCTAFSTAYVPYGAVVMHSGKFMTTKSESLSNMTLQVGIHGKF